MTSAESQNSQNDVLVFPNLPFQMVVAKSQPDLYSVLGTSIDLETDYA